MDKPFLSICIPTNGRVEYLENVLDSIYRKENIEYMPLFEVVVSDNSIDKSSEVIINKYNYENLIYRKSDEKGFMNSINALSVGTGRLLKLHNDTILLRDGVLKKMLDMAIIHQKEKPLIMYSNGLAGFNCEKTYNRYDDFMYDLTYLSSWSNSLFLWSDDLAVLRDSHFDDMFPQTTLLLSQNKKKYYLINDVQLFRGQYIPDKGGYNIFKVFSVQYIDLIRSAFEDGIIEKRTFEKIKKDLIIEFLSAWYFKTKIIKRYCFEVEDVKKYILYNYNCFYYYLMIVIACFYPLVYMRKIIYRFISKPLR